MKRINRPQPNFDGECYRLGKTCWETLCDQIDENNEAIDNAPVVKAFNASPVNGEVKLRWDEPPHTLNKSEYTHEALLMFQQPIKQETAADVLREIMEKWGTNKPVVDMYDRAIAALAREGPEGD